MKKILKAYIDLLRAQFAFAWPLLFCSGLFLAFSTNGGFSWHLIILVVLIGLFGFEAGLVLNDYVDQELDRRDVEQMLLTRYWRIFGSRPLAMGLIPSSHALLLLLVLALTVTALIFLLPWPHSGFVLGIMIYSYGVEVFYQLKKREQRFPLAQIIGRTDFALFPVAGYPCLGFPDMAALSYFIFFYPFALAHLGVNDMTDIRNDEARGMQSITVFYGLQGTACWVAGFTILHGIVAVLFLQRLGWVAAAGVAVGLLFLLAGNILILKGRDPDAALRALPCFHLAMICYAIAVIADVVF